MNRWYLPQLRLQSSTALGIRHVTTRARRKVINRGYDRVVRVQFCVMQSLLRMAARGLLGRVGIEWSTGITVNTDSDNFLRGKLNNNTSTHKYIRC
jgi:hypothetical protein